jgi:hypothetical protein
MIPTTIVSPPRKKEILSHVYQLLKKYLLVHEVTHPLHGAINLNLVAARPIP